MSEDFIIYAVRKGILRIGTDNLATGSRYLDSHSETWQAATASSEAKWRGVVEKLVTRLLQARDFAPDGELIYTIDQAITEAAQMLGGK